MVDSATPPTKSLIKENFMSPQIRTPVESRSNIGAFGPTNNQAAIVAMMDSNSDQGSINVAAGDVVSPAVAKEGNVRPKTANEPIAVNQTPEVESATLSAEKLSNSSNAGTSSADMVDERAGDPIADNTRSRRPSPWIWANRQRRSLFPKSNDGRYNHWKSEHCTHLAKANPCFVLTANDFVTFKWKTFLKATPASQHTQIAISTRTFIGASDTLGIEFCFMCKTKCPNLNRN